MNTTHEHHCNVSRKQRNAGWPIAARCNCEQVRIIKDEQAALTRADVTLEILNRIATTLDTIPTSARLTKQQRRELIAAVTFDTL